MKANTVDTLSGMTKEVYASNVQSLVPESARLQRDAPFVSSDKQEGNAYHQPVRLTRAHGWTLSTSGDAFTLNPAEPARSKDAVVQGSSFVLREVISYPAAAKLTKGENTKASKKAFISGTAYMVENMVETASFILELQCLHGQRDIGIFESRTSGSGTGSQVLKLTAATFIAAMWSGLEQGFLDVWNTGGTVQRNSSEIQVTGVDVENRSITVSGVSAELDAIVATDKFYLRGTKDAGMLGMVSQASNTGTMFTIDATAFSLWAGNSYDAGGAPVSFAKVMRAMNKPVNRGLMSDVRAYVSPRGWTDCMNDLAALRRFADKAGGKIEQGGDGLQFYGQAGSVEFVPHIFMKPSELLVTPKGKMIRLGSSDTSFSMPGMDNDKLWENLPDHAGYGTRLFWNQAIFCPTPNQLLLINNITNSDDV